MKTQNFYYPISYKKIPFRDALSRRLNNDLTKVKVADCLLILMSYTFFLSSEEVVMFFDFPLNSLRVTLHGLVESKLILGDTLTNSSHKTRYDSRTSKIYYLTKKGFKYVREHYRPELEDSDYHTLSKRYMCHDYSIGWNFLSLIANPYLPSVSSTYMEVMFDRGRQTRVFKKDNLRIDGMTDICGDTVYIEQDMISEHDDFLREKFNRYGYHSFNLNTNNACVVLSIKEPYVAPMDPNDIKHGKAFRYSVKHLNSMLKVCKDYNQFYKDDYERTEDIYNAIVDGRIPSSVHTEKFLQVWNECEPLGYVRSYNIPRENLAGAFLSQEYKLEEHIESLGTYDNLMYFCEYGKRQEEVFVKKRNSLIQNILAGGLYAKSEREPLPYDTDQYLSGFHLLMGATYMIDKTMFFGFYDKSPFKRIMEKTLSLYFRNFEAGSYKKKFIVLPQSLYKKEDAPIIIFSLCNAYFTDSWIICVENLAYDVGAAIRLKGALMDISNKPADGKSRIGIICLVRNEEEAKSFYNSLDIGSASLGDYFFVFFMDIWSVFGNIDDEDGSFILPDKINPAVSPLYTVSKSGTVKELKPLETK